MISSLSGKKKIMFFGDSNTYGYDPTQVFGGRYSEDIRWTDILERHFSDSLEVIARGMNGRTIPKSTLELDNLDRTINGNGPLFAFALMVGTNDLVLTESPDWIMAASRMKALIERLKTNKDLLAWGTKIILIAPPLAFPDSPKGTVFEKYEYASKRLGQAYEDIAKQKEIYFIDASKWNVELASDGVHLSERGSVNFAAKMIEEIEALVAEEQKEEKRMNKYGFTIEDNRAFLLNEEGKLVAEVTYPETEPGVFTIDHTFVDDSLRGQGIASKLVETAVEEIEKKGKVQATCSYAVKWLQEKAR